MKKVISLSVVIMMAITAMAQDSTSTINKTMGKDPMQRSMDSTMTQTPTTFNKDTALSAVKPIEDSTRSAVTTAKDSMASKTVTPVTTVTAVTDSAIKVIPTDRVIMKDDKIYMLKSGDTILLQKSYKLESGAVVSTSGSVKYPSGRVVQLKNGQFIELVKPVSSSTTSDTKKTTEIKKPVSTKKKPGNGK